MLSCADPGAIAPDRAGAAGMGKGKSKGVASSTKRKADDLLARFDLESPRLPAEIADKALASGGYPYDERLKRKDYEAELGRLQSELLKLQQHALATGERILVLFEGRDAAGKGTCIGRFLERLNTRHARAVALAKPNEAERGQWYFQRYIAHLPTAGEIVLFDRSWYNRAGVERVMGFCDEAQLADFLRDAPDFEELLVRDGIRLFKFYLLLGREMQLVRFHERRHDPFKRWKLSPIDLAAMSRWDDYTKAGEDMFRFTHTAAAPWTTIHSNDQRRSRLESIRCVLHALPYTGKDAEAVGEPDPSIVGSGADVAKSAKR
jgi:polyphosphate kinase 2